MKELNILQVNDVDKQIQEDEILVMFLKKGIDNTDCYVPVGTTCQGIYEFSYSPNSNSKTLPATSNLKDATIQAFDENHANKTLVKSMPLNYSQLKQEIGN